MIIKTKKQLNLPQLIEWAWENNITNKEYICNEYEEKSVIFNLSGWAEFSDEFSYIPHDTFIVKTEEELTEDTVLPKVLFKNVFDDWRVSTEFCISESKSVAEQVYLLNDDDTIGQLLWTKEKGMVE